MRRCIVTISLLLAVLMQTNALDATTVPFADFSPDAAFYEQLDPGAVAASRRALERGEPVDEDGVPIAAYQPGQIVLRIAPGAELLAEQAHAVLGARVERRIPEGRFERVALPPGLDVASAIRRYRELPFVEHAERNWRRLPFQIPNDPMFNESPPGQWAVRRIGCERAWDVTTGSSSVTIAIVDSGVQSFHDDLGGALVSGWNTIEDNGDTSDTNGHGTAMALIAAANNNNHIGTVGVAPSCSVMPVKAIGPDAGVFDAADGVRWAADHGAHVINMSYGSPYYSLVEDWAVQHAVNDENCVCVGGAGNEGVSDRFYPAALELSLSVGGTDYLSERRWQYSNYGPDWVKVAAPANLIAYTLEESDNHLTEVLGQGTSEACALVSGAAALLFSHLGTSTHWSTVVNRLESNTDPVAESGFVRFGRIDVHEALINGPAPNTFSFPASELQPGSYNEVSGDLDDLTFSDDHRLRLGSVDARRVRILSTRSLAEEALALPRIVYPTLSMPIRVAIDWGGALQLLVLRIEGNSTTHSPFDVSLRNERTGQWVSTGTVSFPATDTTVEFTRLNNVADFVNDDEDGRFVTVRISCSAIQSPQPFELQLDLLRVTAVSD